MKNSIKHIFEGYRMPIFLQDILARHYCPVFLKMSIVQMPDRMIFTYNDEGLRPIEVQRLDLIDKLELFRSVLGLCEETEMWLVKSESYILEPRFLYSSGQDFSQHKLRLLFYPDFRNVATTIKLSRFLDMLRDESVISEEEIFSDIRELVIAGDMQSARLYIDRCLSRLSTFAA